MIGAARLGGLLLTASAMPVAAQDALPIPVAQAAQLAREGDTAKLLFTYDRAAWATTDALLAAVPKARQADVRGWVVEPRGAGALDVVYFGLNGSVPYAIFVGTVRNFAVAGQRVVAADAPEPLDALGVRMAKALIAARATKHRPCTAAPFNAVILPPGKDGRIQVYLLSGQTDAGTVPMGGHFRLTYDANGRLVGDRAYTKACVNMPIPGADPKAAKGGRADALFVTHLLDPIPTEVHSFLSLSLRLPIYVGTLPHELWLVQGTHFTHVRFPDKRP